MKARAFPALALAVALSGCGGGSELVNATGKLTFKGQPVPSTFVTFQPEQEGKRGSRGLTDDDGNFTLTQSMSEKGVFRGKHTVFLKYRVTAEEELGKAAPKASKELREAIARHADVRTSKLHVEVTHGGQHLEINLE
jgi:hypothetical protein